LNLNYTDYSFKLIAKSCVSRGPGFLNLLNALLLGDISNYCKQMFMSTNTLIFVGFCAFKSGVNIYFSF